MHFWAFPTRTPVESRTAPKAFFIARMRRVELSSPAKDRAVRASNQAVE
jgi:hypothetical protein